ncbi:hypothetical protein RD1_2705 [Roseobacter denitrificans OCh 114]|uniref:Uncharacterized protein n=1 Tax=Roseobacter denitrificans (strain ATCC 33942 / OCh 114) TaxID=375451 RepID=Q165U9_ROSDO|nr:hypothetical protein RD1_2705 [Roseobacter denitrificans OCh 114]
MARAAQKSCTQVAELDVGALRLRCAAAATDAHEADKTANQARRFACPVSLQAPC